MKIMNKQQRGGSGIIFMALLALVCIGILFVAVFSATPEQLKAYHATRSGMTYTTITWCYGYDHYGRYVKWPC